MNRFVLGALVIFTLVFAAGAHARPNAWEFRAARHGDKIMLRWNGDLAGFNVFRNHVRLNQRPFTGKKSYHYQLRSPAVALYQLQGITKAGLKVWLARVVL